MPRKHKKKYHLSLTAGQVVFFFFLVACLCGLSYSLGVMVGYDRFAASLRRGLPKKEDLRAGMEREKKATFYESLTREGEPPPGKEEGPAGEKKRSADQGYQVQVGAFRRESEALALRTRLDKAGYPVRLIKSNIVSKGGEWYRVRVGDCPNKAEAEKLAAKIKKEEHLPVLIVR